MYGFVGSGDIGDLLAGPHTKAHRNLWNKFLDEDAPVYNAKSCGIPALQAGAILEENYFKYLPDGYLTQVKVTNVEMNALKVTLDFPLISGNDIVDFDELKSINFDDFLAIQKYKSASYETYIEFIKKAYKKYYNQIQSQLYTTELASSNLSFLVVYSYNEADLIKREIQDNEVIKFRIKRDEETISLIKHRLKPFQIIKDYYNSL